MKYQNVKFFLPKGTLNDATEYYCKLIEKAFPQDIFEVKKLTKPIGFNNTDILVTIRPADLFKLRGKFKKVITWFQGIGPEEYIILHGENIKSSIMYIYLSYLEKKALLRSDLCIFVSDSMRNHYESKYKLELKSKSIIIPCYNNTLNVTLLNNENGRYDNLNFVYAGGLFAWQCIEKTLLIFKSIYTINSTAKLTLLTSDKKKANELISKYELKNVSVDYCSLNELEIRLSEFKYAFLIRENNIVNNVSTPTKMNSYLAAGLIPIYTDVIDAFEANVNLEEYGIKINLNNSYELIGQQIIDYHKQKINSEELIDKYTDIFENYYNDENYINKLRILITS